MKRLLSALIVVSMALTGCASTMSVAPGPTPEKFYLVKTHTFLFFTQSTVELCNSAGAPVPGCRRVPVE